LRQVLDQPGGTVGVPGGLGVVGTTSRLDASNEVSTPADPVASKTVSHSGPLNRSSTAVRVRNDTVGCGSRASSWSCR
jgi:hypothetical protein